MQDLLERLEMWLTNNRPNYADQLLPGLSLEEILEITNPLPFQQSDQVIELYRWHNGTPDIYEYFFSFYRFLPLQEAVEDTMQNRAYFQEQGAYQHIDRDLYLPGNYDWQYYWFSIFYEVKERVVTLGSDTSSISAPIMNYFGENARTTLWFKSLKGFISAILECYETDLYRLEEFGIDDAEEVWAKYHDLE
ncbi:MAG: hypothetical protein ACKO7R_05025 [Pseudanabaena sp.]